MENDEPVVPEAEVTPEPEAMPDPEATPEPEPEGDDYRAKLNAQNRFLEKEGYEFKDSKWVKKPAPAPKEEAPSEIKLTGEDALALAQANVHKEDLPRILKWAKANGQSVSEAIDDADLKIILDTRAEERRTAAATNTGGARGAAKVSGEALLVKAQQTGEVPETDEGMKALVGARFTKSLRKKH